MTRARTNADNVTADIAGITAGTGITGGGTSGTVTITNDMATTIAAKGDILAGTANDAYSALTVGTNGQVLTAASGEATGLSWATPSSGGITQLATGSLSGVSTVTISSISQSYKHLYLVVKDQQAASGSTTFRPNNYSTNNYSGLRWYFDSATGATFSAGTSVGDGIDAGATANNMTFFQLPNYTLTGYKVFTITIGGPLNSQSAFTIGRNHDTTAVSSFTIRNGDSLNWSAGTYTLYGVS